MHTRQKETRQYTCEDCERTYSVGDVIVTGSLSREQLRMRNWRREGYCHCGKRFPEEFEDTKNVKWRMKVGTDDAAPVRDRCSLPRVASMSRVGEESVGFAELRERMAIEPRFADSVLSTAERVLEKMVDPAGDPMRSEAGRKLHATRRARLMVKWEALVEPLAKPDDGSSKTMEGLAKRSKSAISPDTRSVVEAVA